MNKAITGTRQRDGNTAGQSRTPERILIVDDAEAVREFTSLILTAAGYECRTVSSGHEALALLKSGERFDLMVCDLLNNPHGITLLERTKKKCPRMRVIIATAPCCVCTARFAVKGMGASDYLLKPFRAQELVTTIWRTLAGRSIASTAFATA
jgi:DNA-binding NtrC family response regulator